MSDSAETQRYLWAAIRSGGQVNAVRELHRRTLDGGGVPTGRCPECGKPSPCPTELAVAREQDAALGADEALIAAKVQSIRDEHAHELAEKIRSMIGPPPTPGESERVARYVQGWRHAADLIDPEVSDG